MSSTAHSCIEIIVVEVVKGSWLRTVFPAGPAPELHLKLELHPVTECLNLGHVDYTHGRIGSQPFRTQGHVKSTLPVSDTA